MAEFKLKLSGSVIPIEEVTLSDGQDKVTALNSNIDRIFASSLVKSFSTTATNVQFRNYTTTDSFVYADDLFNNLPQTISFLFIRIKSKASSSDPDCRVTLTGGTTEIYLSGVNDFCIVGVNTDALTLGIKSSNSNTLANIEILIAGT